MPARDLLDFRQKGEEAGRKNQHSRPQLFQRIQELLRRLGLAHNANVFCHGKHFGDARPENRLMVRDNNVDHDYDFAAPGYCLPRSCFSECNLNQVLGPSRNLQLMYFAVASRFYTTDVHPGIALWLNNTVLDSTKVTFSPARLSIFARKSLGHNGLIAVTMIPVMGSFSVTWLPLATAPALLVSSRLGDYSYLLAYRNSSYWRNFPVRFTA